MTLDEALVLARRLGSFWNARDDTVASYATVFKDFDRDLMAAAVSQAVISYEKMPTVHAMLYLYQQTKNERVPPPPTTRAIPLDPAMIRWEERKRRIAEMFGGLPSDESGATLGT